MTGTTKLWLVIGGIVLAALAGYTWIVYDRGYGNGRDDLLIEYAAAKPRIDTVRVTEYIEKPVYRERKVPVFVPDPRADSLITLLDRNNAGKDSLIRALSSKASTTFTGPELGILKVEFLPLDRLVTIDHQPPPAKIERVTVTIEKPVLIKETLLEKLPTYALVAASSALVTIWTMKLAQ